MAIRQLLTFAIFFLWFSGEVRSQVEPISVSGRASGNWAYTQVGIQSSFSNQAGLSSLKGFSVSAYGEQTHLLPEFSNIGLALGVSTGNSSGLSLNFTSYGIDEFRQNRVGLGYGMKLSGGLSLGMQIDWYQTSISNYGQNSQLSFRIGGIYKISKDLMAGIHISNPIGLEIADNHPIPSLFNADIQWTISSQVNLGGGLVKDIDEELGIKAAVHYQIHPNLKLFFGVLSKPAKFSFGFSVDLNNFSIQSAGTYHQYLGFSPSAGLTYEQ